MLQTTAIAAEEPVRYMGHTANGPSQTTTWLPQSVPQTFWVGIQSVPPPPPRPRPDKIHPDLRALLSTQSPLQLVEVVVEFNEDIQIPRFPGVDGTKPLSDAANVAILQRRDGLARDLLSQRISNGAKREAQLRGLGVDVRDHLWLTNTILAAVPVGVVLQLAARDDIVSIAPRQTRVLPPTVAAGRQVISSDYLMWYGGQFGNPVSWQVALLDTGTAVANWAYPGFVDRLVLGQATIA